MSQAWIRLRAAVHILGHEGTSRERLAAAFNRYLLGLNPKEVPPEIRSNFIKLLQWAQQQKRSRHRPANCLFELAKDAEVTLMIGLIIDMYDAVTRYEPILTPDWSSEKRCDMPARRRASLAQSRMHNDVCNA